MAELATIARPYAEALFKATSEAEQSVLVEQVGALAQIASDPELRTFADNPRVTVEQIYGVITGAAKVALAPAVANFLRTVLDNGRLAALPLMAEMVETDGEMRALKELGIYAVMGRLIGAPAPWNE